MYNNNVRIVEKYNQVEILLENSQLYNNKNFDKNEKNNIKLVYLCL